MVEFENVCIRYSHEHVLSHFSMAVNRGEKIALSGISGSGKSTILAAIMGFVTPDSGTITIDKLVLNTVNIQQIRSCIAWLPQELSFDIKECRSLVMYPFLFKQNKLKTPSSGTLNALLERLLIDPALLEKQTNEISGGQKQRLLLASILLTQKPLLLLDEPTSALDAESTHALIEEICSLKNTTVISCTHDPLWNEGMQRIIHLKS